MVASGLFFWKKLNLYMNGTYIEKFKLTESLTSKAKLSNNGDFIVAKEKKFSINRIYKDSPEGRQYFYWESDSDEYLVQAFCICVLDIISGMQSVNGTG